VDQLSGRAGPETHSHDELYVTDLDEGRLAVLNEWLGLAVKLTWDSDLYPWVIVWQPYGARPCRSGALTHSESSRGRAAKISRNQSGGDGHRTLAGREPEEPRPDQDTQDLNGFTVNPAGRCR